MINEKSCQSLKLWKLKFNIWLSMQFLRVNFLSFQSNERRSFNGIFHASAECLARSAFSCQNFYSTKKKQLQYFLLSHSEAHWSVDDNRMQPGSFPFNSSPCLYVWVWFAVCSLSQKFAINKEKVLFARQLKKGIERIFASFAIERQRIFLKVYFHPSLGCRARNNVGLMEWEDGERWAWISEALLTKSAL